MGRLDALDHAAVAALEAAVDADLRRKAEEEDHKSVGSAGSLGFSEGSGMARQIEYLLKGDRRLSRDQILRLSKPAVALRRRWANLASSSRRCGSWVVSCRPV